MAGHRHLVHGDFRRANVMARKKLGTHRIVELLMIDMDWAGVEDQDRYREDPNPWVRAGGTHARLPACCRDFLLSFRRCLTWMQLAFDRSRPEEVRLGALLKQEHDRATIRACFGPLWPKGL